MNKKKGIITVIIALLIILVGSISYSVYDYNIARYTRGETFIKIYEEEYQRLDKTVREKIAELAKIKYPDKKYSDIRDLAISKIESQMHGELESASNLRDAYYKLKDEVVKEVEDNIISNKEIYGEDYYSPERMIKILDEAIAEAKK